MMKQTVAALFIITLLASCAKKIDGTDMKTYISSMKELSESLPKEEADSLSRAVKLIISKSGLTLFEFGKIGQELNGMTAGDVFTRAEELRLEILAEEKEKQRVADSIRQAFVTDSIAKYEKTGLWELKYFVDEFKQKTKKGYIQLQSEGIFSNSVSNNAKASIALIVTNNEEPNIFLYEYGNSPVKALGIRNPNEYTVKIKSGSDVHTFGGTMYEDRIVFKDNSAVMSVIRDASAVTVLIKEDQTSYGYSSEYLFKVDVTNCYKALQELTK